ncbi:hypothetical protein [Methylomicrobium sp. Wu6]|uniref:hypothetical protein n=1 Tax=Methylomicrobium sp. Wu6 TaxID=3107928 RepID=UPI002DD627C2|nr:hypothetical protein [Methylomicrobium sp. Wu6]MEC4749808.1 hypothetical protein [Methylomicrobium sp. Wu6]
MKLLEWIFKFLFIFFLIFFRGNAFAACDIIHQYYSDASSASSACISKFGSCAEGLHPADGASFPSCSGSIRYYLNNKSESCGIQWTHILYCDTSVSCSGGKVLNSATGICSCPSGTIDNGLGQCVSQAQACTLQEYNAIHEGCPTESLSGWPQHTCFESSLNQNVTVQECHPNCGPGTHIEGYNCVANPTCIGDQTYNYVTNFCDEPSCKGQQSLDSINHVCLNPQCSPNQVLCNGFCASLGGTTSECSLGYSMVCTSGNDLISHCQYSGCPDGYKSGWLDGLQICTKSGDSTTGTSDGTQSTSTNGSSSTTSTTIINSDGSTTTTSSTTSTSTSSTTTTTNISLDTRGLNQESTQLSVLDTLRRLLGSESDYSQNPSALDGISAPLEPGSSEADAESFLFSGNDSYAPSLNVHDWLPDMPSSSSCSGSIPITWKSGTYMFSPCEKLQPLREVLAWVFYVMTALYIFYVWVSIKE